MNSPSPSPTCPTTTTTTTTCNTSTAGLAGARRPTGTWGVAELALGLPVVPDLVGLALGDGEFLGDLAERVAARAVLDHLDALHQRRLAPLVRALVDRHGRAGRAGVYNNVRL